MCKQKNLEIRFFFKLNNVKNIVSSGSYTYILDFKYFKGFVNNLGTISTFTITPPKSLGKMSMLSWFVNQSEDPTFILSYILADVFMLITALLGFLLIYIVYKKDTFFVNKVIPYFKKLSPIRKLLLGSFTIFTAIPNKFWINIRIHFIFILVISVIVYVLGLVFPFFYFCYLMYLVLCLESFLFGVSYEYSESFRNLINSLLFGNSIDPFAAEYFQWFWGRMWKQAVKAGGALVTGGGLAEAKRIAEIREKNTFAERQAELSIKANQGFKTRQELLQFQKEQREQ